MQQLLYDALNLIVIMAFVKHCRHHDPTLRLQTPNAKRFVMLIGNLMERRRGRSWVAVFRKAWKSSLPTVAEPSGTINESPQRIRKRHLSSTLPTEASLPRSWAVASSLAVTALAMAWRALVASAKAGGGLV